MAPTDTPNRERPTSYRSWRPGEPEEGLLGFLHREERDACAEGHPGPFMRVVRPESWGPVPGEVQFLRSLWPPQRVETRRLN